MSHHTISPADVTLLTLLTSDPPPAQSQRTRRFARRDALFDPLLLAAAAASGPNMTRNHYAHDFFPGVQLPNAQGDVDYSKWCGPDASAAKDQQQKRQKAKLAYVSRQAPRSQRLGLVNKQMGHTTSQSSNSVQVKCMARTRIPTPHGPVFLHLYHNNRDNKEHLAFVVDPAQLGTTHLAPSLYVPSIRSTSLDAIWSPNETEADRLLRGAYIGRLSKTTQVASSPIPSVAPNTQPSPGVPPPLIRIHSECFTGENIGSMRCDCGEQLDEAIRQISQPCQVQGHSLPGRGAVVYMRQEGRGIGLLSKIQAYNLQDMGHDTVSANVALGHKPDERDYEIAAAILRDLGLGDPSGEGVRILTNNPDKIEALKKEDLKIVERVPMVPRSWQRSSRGGTDSPATPPSEPETFGATMIGGGAVSGPDLDKYLRTKVLKMGHILPLWMGERVGEEVL